MRSVFVLLFFGFANIAAISAYEGVQEGRLCVTMEACCRLQDGRVYKVSTPCVCQDIQGAVLLNGVDAVCDVAPPAEMDDLVETNPVSPQLPGPLPVVYPPSETPAVPMESVEPTPGIWVDAMKNFLGVPT